MWSHGASGGPGSAKGGLTPNSYSLASVFQVMKWVESMGIVFLLKLVTRLHVASFGVWVTVHIEERMPAKGLTMTGRPESMGRGWHGSLPGPSTPPKTCLPSMPPLSNSIFRESHHFSLCRAESMRWGEDRHMPLLPCHQECPALSAPQAMSKRASDLSSHPTMPGQ